MALINCPECGKQVSDKAATCINCGCPLSIDNKVRMRLLAPPMVDVYGIKHNITCIGTVKSSSGHVLYKGNLIDVSFEITSPTEVIVESVSGLRKSVFENCRKVVEPGKKYVIKVVGESKGLIGQVRYGIIEVDVFDSDL